MSLHRRRYIPEEFVIVEEKPYHRRNKYRRSNRRFVDRELTRKSRRHLHKNVFVDSREPIQIYSSPRRRRPRRHDHEKEELFLVHGAELLSPRRRQRSSRRKEKFEYVYVIEDDVGGYRHNMYNVDKHHISKSRSLPRRQRIIFDDDEYYYRHGDRHLSDGHSYNVDNFSEEERFLDIIAQPPIKAGKQVLRSTDYNNNSQDFGKSEVVIIERPTVVMNKRVSSNEQGGSTLNEQNGRTARSSTYKRTVTMSHSGAPVDNAEAILSEEKLKKLPQIPDYAVVNKTNRLNRQDYDRITFEKSPKLQESNDAKSSSSKQTSKKRTVTTRTTTTKTTTDGMEEDEYSHLGSSPIDNENKEKNKVKSGANAVSLRSMEEDEYSHLGSSPIDNENKENNEVKSGANAVSLRSESKSTARSSYARKSFGDIDNDEEDLPEWMKKQDETNEMENMNEHKVSSVNNASGSSFTRQRSNTNSTSNSSVRKKQASTEEGDDLNEATELSEWIKAQNSINKNITNDRKPSENTTEPGSASYSQQQADTELIEPTATDVTGVTHNYSDNESDDEKHFNDWEKEDGKGKNETSGNKEGKNKVSFFDSLKNVLSPRKSSKEAKEGDDSPDLKKKPKERLKDYGDQLWERGEQALDYLGEVADYLASEASPWGRIKSCGNPETCKEFQDRIKDRTIFMTPTYSNDEHRRDTELNLERIDPEDCNNKYFVSRSVEYDENPDRKESKWEFFEEEPKSGNYLKMYCDNHKEWESDSDDNKS